MRKRKGLSRKATHSSSNPRRSRKEKLGRAAKVAVTAAAVGALGFGAVKVDQKIKAFEEFKSAWETKMAENHFCPEGSGRG